MTDDIMASCDDGLMKLGSADGDALELSIDGYEYPDAHDPQERFSWHMIRGHATNSTESWAFRFPALTCDESVRLGSWLQNVADRSASDVHGPGVPASISFTEPNLRLGVDPRSQTGITVIIAQLDLEFRAPSNRISIGPGQPNTLQLSASADQISSAAMEWSANVAQYPDGLAT